MDGKPEQAKLSGESESNLRYIKHQTSNIGDVTLRTLTLIRNSK